MDWFFTLRFVPGYSACVKTESGWWEDAILPRYMSGSEGSIPCAIIAGFSIHPATAAGVMKEFLPFTCMRRAKRDCGHPPYAAHLPTFFPLANTRNRNAYAL
jgi:hypothetical protein